MIKSITGDLASDSNGRHEAKNSPTTASAQWELLVLQRTAALGARRVENRILHLVLMLANFNAFARAGGACFLT
jgi:hypothetical protein